MRLKEHWLCLGMKRNGKHAERGQWNDFFTSAYSPVQTAAFQLEEACDDGDGCVAHFPTQVEESACVLQKSATMLCGRLSRYPSC